MTILALIAFCIVTSITPGPNNLMLMSSGATFGLRRTVPHIAGISLGCAVMVLLLGWGMGGIARSVPAFYTGLQIVSTIYLLWLAWRIATATGPGKAAARAHPLTVLEAAAFQWVNPKAWAMVLGAVANFARPDHMAWDVPVIAAVLLLAGVPCIIVWAVSGSALRRFLTDPSALLLFNYAMAALLVLSIIPGIYEAVVAYRG